jgi:hypothetical protein
MLQNYYDLAKVLLNFITVLLQFCYRFNKSLQVPLKGLGGRKN